MYILCHIASELSPSPCVPAGPAVCILNNDPVAALMLFATCVEDPMFNSTAPMYFNIYSVVNMVPPSSIVGSDVNGVFHNKNYDFPACFGGIEMEPVRLNIVRA